MLTKLPEVLVFDLDDTLVSYNAVAKPIWLELAQKYAALYSDVTAELIYNTIATVAHEFWQLPENHKKGRLSLKKTRRMLVETAFKRLEINDQKNAFALADEFSSQRETAMKIFPNAIETLEYFKRKNKRMALLTNGEADSQYAKVVRFKLEQYFEVVQIEGQVGFGKPEIEAYTILIEKLNITPQQACMIGDNIRWDVDGAQKAGLIGIWNDYKKQGLPQDSPCQPDMIINSVYELVTFDKM